MEDSPDELSRFSIEHRARRSAAGRSQQKPPVPRSHIVRDVVLIGFVLVVAFLLLPFSDVANDVYPEARGYADRIQAVFERVNRGEATLPEAVEAADLRVFRTGLSDLVVVTHQDPTEEGVCYGLRIGSGVVTAAVRFPPADGGCVRPEAVAFSVIGSWEDVLPSERITTVWFVPAMVVLVGAATALVTDLVLQIVARRSR